MRKLLRVDLFRLRKDKTPLLGFIVAAVLVLMSLGMFALLYSLTNDSEGGFMAIYSPKNMFIQSFQMGNNVGLVVVIIVAIFTSRDFTQNTLRLKVINGYARFKVYLSMLFTNLIYGIGLILGYGLVMLLIGSLIFGYGSPFNLSEFLKLLATSSMALLYVILFVSIVTAISMKFHTIGASIGLSVAVVIGETIFSMIISSFPTAIKGFPEWLTKGLSALPSIGMTSLSTFTYDRIGVMVIIISSVLLIILVNVLGIRSFNKSDLK
ncbi:MAG: hypothetical protein WC939_03750 [Acholeplasmataceae bacterium]